MAPHKAAKKQDASADDSNPNTKFYQTPLHELRIPLSHGSRFMIS
jgi:hypothetical protein